MRDYLENFLSLDIDSDTLSLVSKTIARYSMFDADDKVFLAFSGGKDSLFTAIALRKLGYDVRPVAINMGYEVDWSRRIIDLIEYYGFSPKIIDVRGNVFKNQLSQQNIKHLNDRLRILDSINPKEQNHLTPCTQCYSIKLIALEAFAKVEGYKAITFGHHGTDAIASLLKSAFMYIDRWNCGHKLFSRDEYEKLVERSKTNFMSGVKNFLNSELYKRIVELVGQQVVATDEPPIQYLSNPLSNLRIVRPMFSIFEYTIKEHRERFFVQTEGSGCGHGATEDTETTREVVHRRILDNIKSEARPMIFKELLHLCEAGLKEDGTLKVDVRRNRETILGPTYKSDFGCYTKL